jgi:D-glycero-D-manno-heptose 1,7-bisphosphate phosphatase
MLDLGAITGDWTLFLDRDGVINHEKKDSYILHYGEFVFYEGVKEAFPTLTARFGRTLIVTNQRGIGKGLMTQKDLLDIHRQMLEIIVASGGRIDKIYFCDSLRDDHPDRKPNPGMALLAKKDFPAIDLSRSVMVGNTLSDMQFGRNAGMHTVYIHTTHPEQPLPHALIDLSFNSLYDFAKALQNA